MSLTTDPNDPALHERVEGGQNKKYLVLSEEERAKGFVRPVMTKYIHAACGGETTMGLALAETYSRDPKFYGATFCCLCGKHFTLRDEHGIPNFFWTSDSTPVGSSPEEAEQWLAKVAERAAASALQRQRAAAAGLVTQLEALPAELITDEMKVKLRKLGECTMKIHDIELKPLDPEIVKALEEEAQKEISRPIRGGLIPEHTIGCDHQWADAFLIDGIILVSCCVKCFVLGMPPR